jgi:hypothetical protein
MRNEIFIDPQTIKDRTGLHANVDDKLIISEIRDAQNMFIMPLLGSNLFLRLQVGIDANNLTANETFLLDNFITDALVYYTLSQLPSGLSYQFYNKGMIRKSSDNTDIPSASELVDMSERFMTRAEFYGKRLVGEIKQNASEKYPLYLNPGTGLDTIHPDREPYKSSIYLGDYGDGGNCIGIVERYQGENGLCC